MKVFCVHPFLSRKRSLPYEIMQMINLTRKTVVNIILCVIIVWRMTYETLEYKLHTFILA
jgi:hypothetical protein